MDGWGSLTMLIKRQEADKFRKAGLRSKLKSLKEGYLNAHESKEEFDFPEISSVEMKILKDQIRKDLRKERIKEIIYYGAILITIVIGFYYLFIKQTSQ
jgi:uncharacterized membrane protein (DUF106 family)